MGMDIARLVCCEDKNEDMLREGGKCDWEDKDANACQERWTGGMSRFSQCMPKTALRSRARADAMCGAVLGTGSERVVSQSVI